jgi:hypothetical protein
MLWIATSHPRRTGFLPGSGLAVVPITAAGWTVRHFLSPSASRSELLIEEVRQA